MFGERSSDWLLSNWNNFQPSLGWHDTLLYLSIPITLIVAQSVSLKILTPPSDDPAVQRSQVSLITIRMDVKLSRSVSVATPQILASDDRILLIERPSRSRSVLDNEQYTVHAIDGRCEAIF